MFDDYNNFYSEAVSLMLPSSKITITPSDETPYTFQNLKFDILVLNEAAHIMTIHEMYASIKLSKCKSSLEISDLELERLKFEESQLSAFRYGEIFNFFEEVRLGDQLKFTGTLFKKKLEIKRKAVELSEKKASENNTQRTTIAFGLIASATLSPELFQPLAKQLGFNYSDDINKLLGISLSIAAVIALLVTTKAIVKLWRILSSQN
ncbi:hypothetical protein BKM07_17945 [Pseudomonas syringae group genomosp. 3]|uniref:Uncharacterized protein n=2 Tax=Pseudomonas TaxID=286 RepID=A0ABD6V874_9PSED|nr:hypothetical protein BKM07_17945 [Pseudomonas syringae group genomosp. 3]